MNILLRNRRKIYLCKRYTENGIDKFEEPKEVLLNFEPTNSSMQVFAFGNVYPLYMKAIVLNKLGIEFSVGDRVYIFNSLPEEHDILCKEADYIVEIEPLQTLNFTEIKFKRLTSDMNYE